MAENWDIGLGLELKSDALSNIQKQIDNIGSSVKPIQLTIDETKIKSQINSIKNQIQSIGNIKIDLNGANSKNNVSNSIASTSRELQAFTKEIATFTAMQKKIGNIKLKIAGLENVGGSSNQIEVLKQQLKDLEKTYKTLYNSFQKQVGSSDKIVDFTRLNNAVSEVDYKLKELSAQYEDTRTKLSQSIKSDISNGTLANQVSNIESKFNKLGSESKDVAKQIEELKSLMSKMDASDDIESVIADYQTFQNLLVSTRNQIKALQSDSLASTQQAKAQKIIDDAAVKYNNITTWMNQNEKAAMRYNDRLQEILNIYKSTREANASSFKNDALELKNLEERAKGAATGFAQIKSESKALGLTSNQLAKSLKETVMQILGLSSSVAIITKIYQLFKQMYTEVLNVDTAMTGLRRVTNLSSSEYEKLYSKMIKSAKEYGLTLDSIISSTASWVRLGFDENTASRLSEITTMYQHVTDLDEKTAVENLVTAYKGYQDELLEITNGDAAQAVMRISDIFDKLGKILPMRNYIG